MYITATGKGVNMRYHIHFGSLFTSSNQQEENCLYYLKPPVYTQNKVIAAYEGTDEFSVEIEEAEAETPSQMHRYLLKDKKGNLLMEGCPGFGYGGVPAPQTFSRTFPPHSRADHVTVTSPSGISGILQMLNSQNFILTAQDGHKAAELIHNGAGGGWNVCADDTIAPVLIMGIFLFSRYLDKENEFVSI